MCSLYISYNLNHGVFRKVLFVAVLFWSRLVHADLAMHATLAALLFWSRLVHADLAMHATLAALGTLPRSMLSLIHI